MPQDFDTWNERKKRIEFEKMPPVLFPKEREVWMCSLGRNIGFEQNGTGHGFGRPALVVKKFNNKMFWIVPLSSKHKEFDFYYNFFDAARLSASAILAQLRLLSVKRFDRKMYEVSIDTFED